MEYTTLGRTGLRVSRLGLGGGGHSRLGLSYGRSEVDATRVVQRALDLGVNFFDSAESYGTESVMGDALKDYHRDSLVLSTKAGVHWQDRRTTGEELRSRVEASAKRLKVDTIDVFHLHGVMLEDYAYAREELVPTLRALKDSGLIRFLGITEAFIRDPGHRMLEVALADGIWDVVMVGFNLLNPSARFRVFPKTREDNVGTLGMFAVRRALSNPVVLRQQLASIGIEDDLEFVWKEHARDLQEAAYRFCRREPGMDVTLCGTGNVDHLEQNVRSILQPALPPAVLDRLEAILGHVDTLTGN